MCVMEEDSTAIHEVPQTPSMSEWKICLKRKFQVRSSGVDP